jgi:hypothetical protein
MRSIRRTPCDSQEGQALDLTGAAAAPAVLDSSRPMNPPCRLPPYPGDNRVSAVPPAKRLAAGCRAGPSASGSPPAPAQGGGWSASRLRGHGNTVPHPIGGWRASAGAARVHARRVAVALQDARQGGGVQIPAETAHAFSGRPRPPARGLLRFAGSGALAGAGGPATAPGGNSSRRVGMAVGMAPPLPGKPLR